MDTAPYRPAEETPAAERPPESGPNKASTAEGGVSLSLPALPDDLPAALRDHVRYRTLRKLGEGGMGAVYLAEHKLMNRPVALKLIRAELAAQPHLIQRFEREVRAAARLTHPNIVHAYDADQAGGSHFLVMEYVEGTDLARLLAARGPLPVPEACECVRQAALGLQHAHEHGLIHRDLKPQNLMRTADGTVKILDFGLARAMQQAWDEGGGGTASGVILGTPDYMAPEQADNASTVDIRADIYSLGCTLYQLLGGRVPFPGRSMLTKLGKHAREQPTPLSELRPQLPPELVQMVARMMAKDPAARYQTPAEVAAALGPWCKARPETVEYASPKQASGRRPFRRRRVLAAVFLLATAGLGTYFLTAWPGIGGDADGKGTPAAPDPRGRVPPSEMSQLQPLVDDDFSGAAKLPFFPPGEEAKQFFQNRRDIVHRQGGRLDLSLRRQQKPPRFTSCAPPVGCADFVCEARCRAEGKGDAGWAIYHDDGGDSTLWVIVRLDGVVEVYESGTTAATAFRQNLGTFRPVSTRRPEGLTDLRVERRGRLLKVFVNGEAVTESLRLEREYAAGHQHIAVWGRGTGEAKAEFARYRLWSFP